MTGVRRGKGVPLVRAANLTYHNKHKHKNADGTAVGPTIRKNGGGGGGYVHISQNYGVGYQNCCDVIDRSMHLCTSDVT